MNILVLSKSRSPAGPVKSSQMFIKVAQNGFNIKIKYFDTFTKIA